MEIYRTVKPPLGLPRGFAQWAIKLTILSGPPSSTVHFSLFRLSHFLPQAPLHLLPFYSGEATELFHRHHVTGVFAFGLADSSQEATGVGFTSACEGHYIGGVDD